MGAEISEMAAACRVKIVADLHIHSHYSRATSARLTPPYLDRWARIKGIDLVGTGDCTHPRWLTELRENLDEAEEGFYTLKEKVRSDFDAGSALTEAIPKPGAAATLHSETALLCPKDGLPRFVLTGEISTIYKRGDKTRKVHHVIILPDFRAAAAFQTALERVGNITSDGRPILGIDSHDLLSILLEVDERSILIPAHIWTPWFSALGAKSGFDSIEECYRDLTSFIPAVETGLSSNPPMNWAVSDLDRFSIISNSDAHSPDKLGREATLLEMDISYSSFKAALKTGILSTIEFFPQEGKYHYDGHRKCGVFLSPEETAAMAEKSGGVFDGRCPICGKPLTRGVMGRVLELADRPVNEEEKCPTECGGTNKRPYHSLIPLREILGELLGTGPASKKVDAAYGNLIEKAGSEFSILMNMDAGEIEKLKVPAVSGELLAQAIGKMRFGEVTISPGYDGEYGVVRVFAVGKAPVGKSEGALFESPAAGEVFSRQDPPGDAKQEPFRKKQNRKPQKEQTKADTTDAAKTHGPATFIPDPDQERTLADEGRRTIIIAGPGTGKTALLASRIGALVNSGTAPSSILALSFTVKAAAELRDRIAAREAIRSNAAPVTATFHSLCCSILREQKSNTSIPEDFRIIGEAERDQILRELCSAENNGAAKKIRPQGLGKYIEERKRFLLFPGETVPNFSGAAAFLSSLAAEMGLGKTDPEMEVLYGQYRNRLRESDMLDFDDLLAGTVRLLASREEILKAYRERFCFVFVDEYQDINFAQYALIRLLVPGEPGVDAGESPALWVIGDPNQAIYGFRGSDKRFIDRFQQDYPDARRFELTRSFRCAASIIKAAGQLTGTSLRGEEKPVDLFRSEYPTEKSEAEGIARRIAALIGGTSFFALDSNAAGGGASAPEDCAILIRAGTMAEAIIKALKDHGIPFDLTGEEPWWEDEPVKSLIDLLRDQRAADINGAWELLLRNGALSLGKKKEMPDSVKRFIALGEMFENIPALIDALSYSGAEGLPAINKSGVRVMTIHASKGLEFDHVFVAGLEEGMLPFTLYDESVTADRIEEERRILYVAMTRARKGLNLSWARSRNFRGRILSGGPSRFLSELEKIIPLLQDRPPAKKDPQMALF
ncbi:DNA helicase [Spirochaetia bacterium]|nr:DNA helicase [Spirochaetia bacterium]